MDNILNRVKLLEAKAETYNLFLKILQPIETGNEFFQEAETVTRVRKEIEKKLISNQKEIQRMKKFYEELSAGDEELKQIISCRQQGKTWNEVNEICYGYPGYACRTRIERRLKKYNIENF